MDANKIQTQGIDVFLQLSIQQCFHNACLSCTLQYTEVGMTYARCAKRLSELLLQMTAEEQEGQGRKRGMLADIDAIAVIMTDRV